MRSTSYRWKQILLSAKRIVNRGHTQLGAGEERAALAITAKKDLAVLSIVPVTVFREAVHAALMAFHLQLGAEAVTFLEFHMRPSEGGHRGWPKSEPDYTRIRQFPTTISPRRNTKLGKTST